MFIRSFSYTSDFDIMSLFFTLYHIVSSYHEKIYLTQGLSYTSDFLYYVIIFHFVSWYHRITKKYILLRAFHIPRIFILCHHFSLRIIVSSYHEKISYSVPFVYLGFLYYVIIFHFVSYYHRITKKYILPRAFHIPRIFILCHHFSLCIIVSSYHEKIYLTQGLSYTLDFLYYVIIFHFVSYHRITKKYLTQGLSYTLDFYIMSLFFTSYHRITEKYILLRAFHIPQIFIYLYMRNIHIT